jgi:hypothetical protein
MCTTITAAFTRPNAFWSGHERGSVGTSHSPCGSHLPQPPHRAGQHQPGRGPWWMWCTRHSRALLGTTLVLAALIVLLWPGPLLFLILVALGLAIVLAGVVAIMVYLALRRQR